MSHFFARHSILLSLATSVLLSGNVLAQPPARSDDALMGIINVKNLKAADPTLTTSAMGDAKTDDTAAIQAAAELAKKRTIAYKPDEGTYLGTSPVIYFPAGRYLISDEIQLGGYANIVSDSRAIIEQKTPDKRILVFAPVFTISVRGLRFVGGKNQIYMENKNIDGTMLDISECEFQASKDAAIMTHGTTSPQDQHMSANLMINKCKFIRSRKILRNVCDYAVVRDSWVTVHMENFDRDSAAFVNTSGVLMFDNMIGIPVFGSMDGTGKQSLDNKGVDKVRWVDNYGTFIAQKSRFGGEYGGIPIVHHFGMPGAKHPAMGQTIIIENSTICAGPSSRPDSAVVTLRGGIPQLLRITGNNTLIDGKYLLNDGLNVASLKKEVKDRIQFEIETNMVHPVPAFPKELSDFRKKK